ncbi:tyrosine-type recombinase/integrase [Pragia fontium]|uniref:Integrase DNA-binding domain-containing protein n=1 Tax=Pragia fontium DSM 5563 = ATCC 49100 TaxID=1122977 RepID=A0AAJ5BFW5_9GAMM|nr:Arm DNA-binding domain-containing protein [Pragia fontium]SFC07465.1 protein of unknown function [Pragia fontium DSM 5563 = ATCC 49100]
MPLNDTQLRNFKPKEKLYKRADGHGLYILVNPNGSKHWYRKYSFQGKETRASYGRYPQISLADARKMRDADIALLARDINPNAVRQDKKEAQNIDNSFEVIARRWHSTQKKWSANHAARVLKRMVFTIKNCHM